MIAVCGLSRNEHPGISQVIDLLDYPYFFGVEVFLGALGGTILTFKMRSFPVAEVCCGSSSVSVNPSFVSLAAIRSKNPSIVDSLGKFCGSMFIVVKNCNFNWCIQISRVS